MRRFVTVTLACIALLALAAAAAAGSDFDTDHSFGDKELLFRVYGVDDIGVGTFDGGLGFRWFLSENFALRPGFSYSTDENKRLPDSDGNGGRDISEDRWAVDLVLERHLEPRGRWESYWGLGFSIGSYQAETRYLYADPNDGVTLGYETDGDSYAFLGVFGLQWTLTEMIRFGAEYQLQYQMTDTDQTQFVQTYDDQYIEDENRTFDASTTSLYAAIAF